MATAGVAIAAIVSVAVSAPSSGSCAHPGGYRHTVSETAWLLRRQGQFAVLRPTSRELWVAPDGSGHLIERETGLLFFGQRDRAAWERLGREPQHTDERYPPGSLEYPTHDVPTDTQSLRRLLVDSTQADAAPGARGLTTAGDLLRETVAPPHVVRALYEALIGITGVERLDAAATDRAGPSRSISAVSGRSPKLRRTLTFDADLTRLLSERLELLEPDSTIDARPPVEIGFARYVVSEMSQTAPGLRPCPMSLDDGDVPAIA